MQDKKTLRKEIRSTLKNLSPETRAAYQVSLLEQLLATEQWQQAKTVAITIAMGMELQTADFIAAAQAQGKTVYVPRTIDEGRQMFFCLYNEDTKMEVSPFGVAEPVAETPVIAKSDIDLILVPGLMFSADGYRVGHGGGYYDRYLAGYEGQTIAFAYPEMFHEKPIWEMDQYDIPVQQVIVAKG